MQKKEYINEYINNKKNLTLLKGKIPILKNWTKKHIEYKKIINHKDNIGWVIGKNDLIIDIDPRNNGNISLKKLLKKIKKTILELNPIIKTPSGGIHCYLKIKEQNEALKLKKNILEYPGIDFLHKGCMCVIPGSDIKNIKYKPYQYPFKFKQIYCPKEILDLIKNEKEIKNTIKNSKTVKYNFIDKNTIQKILSNLNPSINYNEWLKIGMSLHSWDKILGLKIWEDWSKNGKNYVTGETLKKWKSFNENKDITIGTLFHFNKKKIYNTNKENFHKFLKELKKKNEIDIENNFFEKIETFSEIQKEQIFQEIQKIILQHNKIKIPITKIKKIYTDNKNKNKNNYKWNEDWIFVNSHSSFLNKKTLELHSQISFNTINGKYINNYKNNIKPSAVKYVCDNGLIENVSKIEYLPNKENEILEINNKKIFNIFNHKIIPKPSNIYTKKGIEAIKIIKNHIKFLFEKEKDEKIFTYWLAHQIQFPGKKILWAPIICSIPGVGKSFLGEILKKCLGQQHVGIVSPNQVTSEFNGWAKNVLVNILEELRIKGHNRFEAINSLKPLITDKHIQINEKCVKQYLVKNVTNYICFTNERDSIVFNKNDRRWWVIFVPIEDLDNLENYVNFDKNTYFIKLFSSLNQNVNEIIKWLKEIKIPDEFMNLKQAPMTDYKKSMIITENLNIDYFFEIKELIKKGNKYFNENVICCSDLFDCFFIEYPDVVFKTIQKNIILKKLGYIALPNPLKINGKTRRIWAKKIISHEKVRKYLNI